MEPENAGRLEKEKTSEPNPSFPDSMLIFGGAKKNLNAPNVEKTKT